MGLGHVRGTAGEHSPDSIVKETALSRLALFKEEWDLAETGRRLESISD